MSDNRKKISEAAREFIGSQASNQEQNDTDSKTNKSANINPETAVTESSLKSELLGNIEEEEPTIRLTVDLPRPLHRRLNQLSLDSGKPKSELVRIMIRRALESVEY